MPVSPKEIMRGCILNYEGKSQIVKGVSEYIIFEGWKEWIGGSLINGEPITEWWLEQFGFHYDPPSHIWQKGPILFYLSDEGFRLGPKGVIYNYIHELQILYWIIVKEHLKTPKLK